MLRWKSYICVKCGKVFTKAVGGVVMVSPLPVCDKCKLDTVAGLFKPKK